MDLSVVLDQHHLLLQRSLSGGEPGRERHSGKLARGKRQRNVAGLHQVEQGAVPVERFHADLAGRPAVPFGAAELDTLPDGAVRTFFGIHQFETGDLEFAPGGPAVEAESLHRRRIEPAILDFRSAVGIEPQRIKPERVVPPLRCKLDLAVENLASLFLNHHFEFPHPALLQFPDAEPDLPQHAAGLFYRERKEAGVVQLVENKGILRPGSHLEFARRPALSTRQPGAFRRRGRQERQRTAEKRETHPNSHFHNIPP